MHTTRAVSVVFLFVLLSSLTAPTARGATYLLLETFSEGPIDGDVISVYPDAIEVLDFSQTSVFGVDPLTGQPDGRQQFFPLQFSKRFDNATIELLRALATLERLTRFELIVVASGSGIPLLRVELIDGFLTSVDTFTDHLQGFDETWTVAFERIRWEDLQTGEIYEDGMSSTSVTGGLPDALARVSTVPNPTSGPTEFSFRVPTTGHVSIDVFDFRGRRVANVYEGTAFRSEGVVPWSGLDEAGRPIASGVYLVKMRAGEWLTTQKLTVVR